VGIQWTGDPTTKNEEDRVTGAVVVRKSVLVGVGRNKLISHKGLFIFNRNGLVSDSSWQTFQRESHKIA